MTPTLIKCENIIKITPEKKELGFVGNPKKINKEALLNIVTEKKVPIVAPMGVGDDGKIYNINADIVSGSIAKELNSRRLLLMTDVEEGCEFFENIQSIRSKLITLKHVGLGYMKIGQQATTLSGGEAQRIKLAKEHL